MSIISKFGKRFIVLALSLMLVVNTVNSMTFSALAEVPTILEVEATIEDSIELPKMETSALPLGWFGLSDGNVELKSGNWERWIDRVDLSETTFVTDFYESLEEASDNDGLDDWLIEDTYFNQEEYKVPITEVTGTMASASEAADIMNDILNRYSLYVDVAVNAFDRDHPEVFWLSGASSVGISMSYGTSQAGYAYVATLYFIVKTDEFDIRSTEYQSQSAIETAIATRDTKVAEFMSAVSGMSDYEKVVYFNEKLTTSNEYNTSADLNHIGHDCRECVSALTGKKGTEGPVCEGYARAFKVLCDEAGIPCVLVDGYARNSTSSNGEGHMWNNIEMNGSWYAVDVTWNDPAGGASGAVSGYEGEEWLLVGSETVIGNMTFAESHPVENRVSSTGISFINGPELSTVRYEASVVTPTPEVTEAPIETAVPTEEPTVAPTEAPTEEPTEEPTIPPAEIPTPDPDLVVVETVEGTCTYTEGISDTTFVFNLNAWFANLEIGEFVELVIDSTSTSYYGGCVGVSTLLEDGTIAWAQSEFSDETGGTTSMTIVVPYTGSNGGEIQIWWCDEGTEVDITLTANRLGKEESVTPEPTVAPTTEPTAAPTEEPTAAPTEEPTAAPTEEPTAAPTEEPTAAPTEEPTAAPTEEPTAVPTEEPTAAPTEEPTAAPTEEPTAVPTEEPTPAPTEKPTPAPTAEPTPVPTEEPAAAPVDSFVTRMYQQCLSRDPDQAGKDGWVGQLEGGHMDGADIAEQFVFSQEMLDKNLSNEDFVKVLYTSMMGREADVAGLNGWVNQLKGGYMTRSEVTKSFVESVEFTEICASYGIIRGTYDATIAPIEHFVTRFYTLCLERNADQAGLYGWVGNLKNQYMNGAQIANSFFFSEEFVKRNVSDEKYIELLYNTLMGRPSDENGKAGWLNQLQNNYMTRMDMLKSFIESKEFTEICDTYGITRGSL